MGCSSGLLFPSPGDLPNPETEPMSLTSPALAGRFFTTEPPGKPPKKEVRREAEPPQRPGYVVFLE